jgi:hypothetical protein
MEHKSSKFIKIEELLSRGVEEVIIKLILKIN